MEGREVMKKDEKVEMIKNNIVIMFLLSIIFYLLAYLIERKLTGVSG